MNVSNSSDIGNRLAKLRLKMEAQKLDAFIALGGDPHGSEYIADHWQFRPWISGFSGSSGVVFVTANYAGLSTDSRYFIQAEEELAQSSFVLHRQKVAHSPQVIPWLKQNLAEGSTVGIDPRLVSVGQANAFRKSLQEKGIELRFSEAIIDEVWTQRPPLPAQQLFELPLSFAGQSVAEKLTQVRSLMREKKIDYHLISTLDDIAWLFNIRGYDVESNPVVIAYALLSPDKAVLFLDTSKASQALSDTFKQLNIHLQAYETISDQLGQLGKDKKILLDPSSTNAYLYKCIHEASIVKGPNLSTALKAVKHPIEIKHIKQAMRKDGIALTRLYRWLDKTLEQRSVPETEVAQQLAAFRKEQGDYYGESFSAIVGYQGNGAIVHYRAKEGACASIQRKGILLLDSGGQYYDGTTDITRTTALSSPTSAQKRDYTLVLKGHIAVATLKFPYGTRGNQIDLLARKALWDYGLNYGHGTGHGVGYFLNVHEGPQSISSGATGKAAVVFEPGMLTSNEPGFYKTNEYGIRIENLILCVEDQQTEYGRFLKFETLTLFPIDTLLIDFPLLTKEEVDWLNAYHVDVLRELTPLLNEEELTWMQEKCKAV